MSLSLFSLERTSGYVARLLQGPNARNASGPDQANDARRGAAHIEDLAKIGSFEVDFDTTAVHWSNGTYKIFGLVPGTPVSLEEALRFYDANTRREIEARVEAARVYGQAYDVTIPFRPRSGEARWMRVIAQVSRANGKARLVGAVQDVTRERSGEADRDIEAERSRLSEPDERLLDQVRQGLARGEFIPFFQPIVDLETRIVRGWEALVRWQHPERGLLLPGQFAAALAHPSTSAAIDTFMLSTSLGQLRAWLDAGLPVTCAGVNVSEAQLKRSDFAQHVLTQLEAHRLTADRLKIEVLETAFLGQDTGAVAATIDQLGLHGVVCALDDFGTGYASLTHLKQFRVERIKIDRSFVANLGLSAFDHAIVRCLTRLGADLGIRITAEGIETAEQLRILRSMGCDCGQGYLFSPPLPADAVPGFLQAWYEHDAARVLGSPVEADEADRLPFRRWAVDDAAAIVSCLGVKAHELVQGLAQAERSGALTDLFPAHHFAHVLRAMNAQ